MSHKGCSNLQARKGEEEAEKKEENDKVQIKRQSVSDDDSFRLGDRLSRGM